MRRDEHRRAPADSAERSEHASSGHRVQALGRLVEEQHGNPGRQRARYRDQAPLAAGERASAGTDHVACRAPASFQLRAPRARPAPATASPHEQRHVFQDRSGDQWRVLRHPGERSVLRPTGRSVAAPRRTEAHPPPVQARAARVAASSFRFPLGRRQPTTSPGSSRSRCAARGRRRPDAPRPDARASTGARRAPDDAVPPARALLRTSQVRSASSAALAARNPRSGVAQIAHRPVRHETHGSERDERSVAEPSRASRELTTPTRASAPNTSLPLELRARAASTRASRALPARSSARCSARFVRSRRKFSTGPGSPKARPHQRAALRPGAEPARWNDASGAALQQSRDQTEPTADCQPMRARVTPGSGHEDRGELCHGSSASNHTLCDSGFELAGPNGDGCENPEPGIGKTVAREAANQSSADLGDHAASVVTLRKCKENRAHGLDSGRSEPEISNLPQRQPARPPPRSASERPSNPAASANAP